MATNPPSPAKTRKKRGWLFWLLVIGVPAVVLAYAAAIVGFGFLFTYTAKQLPASKAEWDVVVDAHDVAHWLEGMAVEDNEGTLSKVRYFDGSYDIEYEYDPPDGAVYISSTLTVERKLTDAFATYLPLWTATAAGFSLGGEATVEIDERKDFFEWGDQSRFAVLLTDGDPFGNLFIARDGTRVVFFLLAGVYFDDRDLWSEFIGPTLQNTREYKPQ